MVVEKQSLTWKDMISMDVFEESNVFAFLGLFDEIEDLKF